MDQFEKASPPRAGSPMRGSLARAMVGAVIGTLTVATFAFGAAARPAGGAGDAPRVADAATPIMPIDLALHLEDGFVRLGWSVCDTDGFRYYAVVRSMDDQPTWPVGDGDTVIAVVEDIDEIAFHDTDLVPGTELFYRVFAIADPVADLEVVCQSPIQSVVMRSNTTSESTVRRSGRRSASGSRRSPPSARLRISRSPRRPIALSAIRG